MEFQVVRDSCSQVPGGSQQARLDSLRRAAPVLSKPSNPIRVLAIKMVKGQECAPKLKSKAVECTEFKALPKSWP